MADTQAQTAAAEAEQVAAEARAAADAAKEQAAKNPTDAGLAKIAADAEAFAVEAEQEFEKLAAVVAEAVREAEKVVLPAADAAAAAAHVVDPSIAPEIEDADRFLHVAARDFKARYAHQLLTFAKDQVIDPLVGAALRATGAPIKLVEKAVVAGKAL